MTITFVPMSASHFLLMDDDPKRAQRVTGVLRETGQQVVQVSDAREAVRALEVPGLDVLILGLGVPGLDLGALRKAMAPGDPVPPESLEAAERRHIARALEYTSGNKRRTAQLLGIARSTLLAKVRKYGLGGDGRARGRRGT